MAAEAVLVWDWSVAVVAAAVKDDDDDVDVDDVDDTIPGVFPDAERWDVCR